MLTTAVRRPFGGRPPILPNSAEIRPARAAAIDSLSPLVPAAVFTAHTAKVSVVVRGAVKLQLTVSAAEMKILREA